MSEELYHHLRQAVDIMLEELIEVTEGIEIQFLIPIHAQLENEETIIKIKSIRSGIIHMNIAEFEAERHINTLNIIQDFNIIYMVYVATIEALIGRPNNSNKNTKGERKTDR